MAGEHEELINLLNQAVSLEYTGAIQYNQHSMLLTGKERQIFEGLFQEHAKEALAHAKKWGERVVYLGGVPTVEVHSIQQSTDLDEMLEMDLELEKKAVDIYQRAHKACRHAPTQYLLEDHIMAEDKDVEELQKLLRQVKIAEASTALEKEVSAAGQH